MAAQGSVAWSGPSTQAADPAADDGLPLHVGRTLFDGGTLVAHCPSLAGLGPGAVVRLHPDTAAAVGVRDGDKVTARTEDATFAAGVVVDAAAVAGVAFVAHAQADAFVVGPATTVTFTKAGA